MVSLSKAEICPDNWAEITKENEDDWILYECFKSYYFATPDSPLGVLVTNTKCMSRKNSNLSLAYQNITKIVEFFYIPKVVGLSTKTHIIKIHKTIHIRRILHVIEDHMCHSHLRDQWTEHTQVSLSFYTCGQCRQPA